MIKTRYIPQGYKKDEIIINHPGVAFEVYTNLEQPHNPKAMFFVGKQSAPIWNYRFPDIPSMTKEITSQIENLVSAADYKAKRKEERKQAIKNVDVSILKVGDVYHWSGGYNCTRNDYIKVISIKGKKAQCVDLGKKQFSGDWMNGEVMPVLENEGKEITMAIRPSYTAGQIMLRNTGGGHYKENYYKWNGKPNWENCD